MQCLCREVSQKEREYIGMKESLDKKNFLEKMQKCKGQKMEIKETINIGKSIGDLFAYIFYRNKTRLNPLFWRNKLS